MRLHVPITSLVLTLLLATGPALADPEGKAKGHDKDKGPPAGGRVPAAAEGRGHPDLDGDWDIDTYRGLGVTAPVLSDWLGADRHVLDVDVKPLPPGIAKNLARGKPLPPGIAKRYPADPLARRLPRVEGHDWIEAGDDLVLINAATGIVADIIVDALY